MGIYFVDEYDRQLDERGRIILPAKVREKISQTVFITQSPTDKCLQIYTEEEWGTISDKLRDLPVTTDPNARAFVRLFFGTAASSEVDKQGRILLASNLKAYANLEKDVVIIGQSSYIEIWSAENWNEYNKAEEINLDELVTSLSEYGL